MTTLEPLQQIGNLCVCWHGRKLLYFSGCDYFRLANHPAVLKAVADGMKRFGLNVAASRLTTGHHKLYDDLELALAGFFGAEDALLVPNGYMTGIVVAQALAGNFSHAVMDERAHPALKDAAEQLNCPILKFKHRDTKDFARTMTRCGRSARPIILTDGMFSHDGSVAPLKEYRKFLPRDGMILVDDAHGAGVLGKNGRGTPEFENVNRRQIIQCITLSKAFGVFGGAILGTKQLRERIFERSHAFIGSTPLPLPLVHAALRSVTVLKTRGKDLRRKLQQNTSYVKEALRKTSLHFLETPGPIVSFTMDSHSVAEKLKDHLLATGIFPPFLRYPGGSVNGYFRFAISSGHSRSQLDKLINALENF